MLDSRPMDIRTMRGWAVLLASGLVTLACSQPVGTNEEGGTTEGSATEALPDATGDRGSEDGTTEGETRDALSGDDAEAAETTRGDEDIIAIEEPPPECAQSSDCNDDNGCTTDICDIFAECVFISNSEDCDDDNPCTLGDECDDGACVGDLTECDDANVCTTDTCDFEGDCVYLNNAEPCDDGSECTQDDHCAGGGCLGGGLVTCDDELACTTDLCDPDSGECTYTPIEDGQECDDGDLCTAGDVCVELACQPGEPIDCDDGNECTGDACDSESGFCTVEYIEGPCDDSSVCSIVDACLNGKCVGLDNVDCGDDNPCTDDPCDPITGVCSHVNNTKPCDDGQPCTFGDQCEGGGCQAGTDPPCDDQNACTVDACDSGTGECSYVENPGVDCEDGLPCTVDDFCEGMVCMAGGPKDCGDDNDCTEDYCVADNGECGHVNADGLACDDGEHCMVEDTCQNAECAGTPKDCQDDDPCTVGETCDDATGDCLAGSPKDCNDDNQCTVDSCDGETGDCVNTPNDSNPCSDGLNCTLDDHCQTGACLSTPKDCDDGMPCTDGEACNPVNGECTPGKAKDCDDDSLCTDDSCDPETGDCVNENHVDGSGCDLPTACEEGTCQAGVCILSGGLDCNDGNPCTIDTCDAVFGCQFSNEDCGSSTIDCLTATCDPVEGCLFQTNDQACNDNIGCTLDLCVPGEGCGFDAPAGCCDEKPLLQSFEGGATPPGWQLTGGSGAVKWQAVAGARSTNGLGSLYYGNPAVKNFSSSGSNAGKIFSPSFVVPSTSDPRMVFYIWMNTELSTSYDKLFVRVNGTQVWTKSSSTVVLSQWNLVNVSLAQWAGQSVTVEWDFNTIDSIGNGGEGIYVDDMRVLGCN